MIQTPENTELEGLGVFTWLRKNTEELRQVGVTCRTLTRNPKNFLSRFLMENEKLWCTPPIKNGGRFHVMLQDKETGKKIADSVMDDGNLGKVGLLFSKRAMCVFYLAFFMSNRGRNFDVDPPTISDLVSLFNLILEEDVNSYDVKPPSSGKDHSNEIFGLILDFHSTFFNKILPQKEGYHIARNCRTRCYSCGNLGHIARNCRTTK